MATKKRTNDEALDLFADLLEPAAEIIGDKEVADILKSGDKPIKAIKVAIKKHKSAVVEVLARIDGVEPSKYEVNVLTLPVKLIELLNRPEVQELFTSQGQENAAGSFGSVTENTEDGAI